MSITSPTPTILYGSGVGVDYRGLSGRRGGVGGPESHRSLSPETWNRLYPGPRPLGPSDSGWVQSHQSQNLGISELRWGSWFLLKS